MFEDETTRETAGEASSAHNDPRENAWPGHEPHLSAVWADIQAVLERHNVAAAVALTHTTAGSCRLHFPAWSLIGVKNDRLDVRLRADHEERSKASVALLMKLGHVADAQAHDLRGHIVSVTRGRYDDPRIVVTSQMPKLPGLPR
jgi:hypothetical protein